MWAAIVKGERSEWINPHTIGYLRYDAKKSYLEMWTPEYRKKALARVRFAKVTVRLADDSEAL